MMKAVSLFVLVLLKYEISCRPLEQDLPEAMKNAKPPPKTEKIIGAENDKYSPKTQKQKEQEWKSEQSKDKFEGDMMLTKSMKENLLKEGVQLREVITNTQYRWPSRDIPYVLDSSLDDNRKQIIQAAITDFNENTCVNFIQRSTQADYIRFNQGQGCWSWVGKIGGAQELSLGDSCVFKGVALHELMHALGFFHEHTRRDRDTYVTINHANIQSGMEANFQQYGHGEADEFGASYDYGSVMHYPKTAFANSPGLETITLKMPYTGEVGQRQGFSPIDITQIRQLFNCDDVTTVQPPTTASQTTAAPNQGSTSSTLSSTPTTAAPNTNTNPVTIKQSSIPPTVTSPGPGATTKPPTSGNTKPSTGVSTVSPKPGSGLGGASTARPGGPGQGVAPGQSQCPVPCPTPCPTYCTNTVIRPQAPVSSQGQQQQQQPHMQAVVQSNQPCKAFQTRGKNGDCLHVVVGYPNWPSDFHWSSSGIPWNCNCNCVGMNEPMDPDGWSDNFLCYRSKVPGKKPIIKWSHKGPLPNMRCVRTFEPSDPDSWNDNYLCTPHDSPYKFMWSPRGPINKPGVKCLKIDEPNETNEWRDNFLCAESLA